MANQRQFVVGKTYNLTSATKRKRKLKFLGNGNVGRQQILLFTFLRKSPKLRR